MIQLVNLSKTYKTKKVECEALKGLNLRFPSKGLVFIVGKSGSGKSTLLNLLGGIDYPTSGDILCNGLSIHRNKSSLESYRSNCIGFVFQDYCLIETMTVYDNIEIGLSLNGLENHDLIMDIIDKLDLKEKVNTPVNLLSGGQKQRVAIARALVKNPYILLADEPTGNLDSKTSTQTFEILKKLSKDKLVIIISHNLNEAYKYADRIIELSEGKIINDIDKINIDLENKNIAVLSSNSNLSSNEINHINNKLAEFNVIISNNEMMFQKHIDNYEEHNFEYTDTLTKLKKKFKLYWYFIKKKIGSIIINTLMISTLIILMGLCQSYNNVNEAKLIKDAIDVDTAPLIFRKGYYNEIDEEVKSDYLGAVTEEDIEAYRQAGYDGNIYKLYRYPIPLIGNYCNISDGREESGFGFSNGLFLDNNGYGVLQCDLEYLIDVYGVNGELDVLSGQLDLTDYGIIITDYFADCILSRNPSLISTSDDKYAKLINTTIPISRRFVVNAVINTNYKERYEYIINKLDEMVKFPSKSENIMDELKRSDITKEFLQENKNYLGIGYSLNSNFIADNIENSQKACFVTYFENGIICDENNVLELYQNEKISITMDTNDYVVAPPTNDGEVYITPTLYNALFNTNIKYEDQTDFIERDIYLNLYSSHRKINDKAKINKKLTIKGLVDYSEVGTLIVSSNDYKELRSAEITAYALYFSGKNNQEKIYQIAESLLYKNSSIYVSAIQEIVSFTSVFKSIFVVLIGGLIATTVLLLCNYSLRLVNSYKRELGIIKAMGGKNKDFQVPFMIIVLIIGVISSILCSVGILNVCEYMNGIIANRLALDKELPQLLSINLLQLSPTIIVYDLLILFGLISLSILSPIYALRRIKIVDILRRE